MKLENNNNILCTVSAGYSSVYLAAKIKEWYPDHNIVFAMANTSKEHKASLQFMNECDEYYGIGLNWIEAVINQERGVGTGFRIVDLTFGCTARTNFSNFDSFTLMLESVAILFV